MDRYGGSFGDNGAFDDAEPFVSDAFEEAIDHPPQVPPSPVGQDERRMQVRAYNHWAGLLGNGGFPKIADLAPETLDDFGPYGVLLDFGGERGIDNPAIRFLGAKLAEECGENSSFRQLSDVPSGSLLSRITDHYLQIVANQAPIGFEAEFVNERFVPVLYRGILLPWSRDGETIDFIFGVINWKELADPATAEALLTAIDMALERPVRPYEGKDMDRMLDLSGFAEEPGFGDEPVDLPTPAFGAVSSPFDLVDELGDEEDYDEDAGETTEWGAGFSGFGDEDTVYTVDYGDQGLEDGEEDEDCDGVVDPLGDQTASLGLSSLVSRSGKVKQSVVLPGMNAAAPSPKPVEALAPFEDTPKAAAPRTTLEQRLRAVIPQGYGAGEPQAPLTRAPIFAAPPSVPETGEQDPFELEATFEEQPPMPAGATSLDHARQAFADQETFESVETPTDLNEDVANGVEGLYDCLAAARELAQTAHSSEDRGRKALYQAVARAYDFSIEAAANPADFDELLAENGLTVQDRAPMTPIVKLVFGADYDKTRLTEYATVLCFAHRTGVSRGTLGQVLARAEGGLKGVVNAERQARKEADGKALAPRAAVKNSLARKLRKLDQFEFRDLDVEGPEFALVMVRRLPSGEMVVLGEVPEDVPFVEKAARKLLS